MGMAVGSKQGIKSDINVTPLVDVVLVLLIIFMVVTPMLQRGKDVRLPKAARIDKETKESDPMILSITPNKETYLEQDRYDEDGLKQAIAEKLAKDPGRRILLKGDFSLSYGDVRKVMNVARKAGAKSLSFGVEELK